jgi:hypothetical protein
VLDCKASLKCFELNVKTMTQNRNKPRAAKSCKQFKKFFEIFEKFFKLLAKALKTVLHCKASLIAAQCNKTTHGVGLLHTRSLKIYSR